MKASQVAWVVKKPPANAGDVRDMGSIPGLGRSPGGGHGNPFQYSCLENAMGSRAWQAMVHRITQSQTWLKWLSTHTHTHTHTHWTMKVLPRWCSDKESACQCKRHKRHGFDPWVRKIPWRRAWQPTSVFMSLENPMDRGAWRATVHRVAKRQTRLKWLSTHHKY